MTEKTLGRRYKKALVTGASSGLGNAFTQMLGAEGISVLATARDPNRIEHNEHTIPTELDLLDKRSVDTLVAKISDNILPY